MKKQTANDAFYLLAFFALLILMGTFALLIPAAWGGPSKLHPLDAFFTACSAVCVTGLATVDTASYTRLGQGIILALIQLGGLGIISFTSILISIPGQRIPFRRLNTIKSFYTDGVEFEPAKIVRSIVVFTLAIEGLGALALYGLFRAQGTAAPAFTAVFHSISAFCNAGFSTFSDSMESFNSKTSILIVLSALFITGGLGFIVLQDLGRRLAGKNRRLTWHSKAVLATTAFLLLAGSLAFLALEWNRSFDGMAGGQRIANAFFQAATPRTAGFNAVPQGALSQPSKVLVIILMFIGGAPGSIAGGIKVTTFLLVLVVMTRRPGFNGDINVFHRRLPFSLTNKAVVYFLKALALLAVSAGALSLVEGLRGAPFEQLVFESVSAFGTVGLSMGYTPQLGPAGKLIIIFTMFAGRVGLIALAFPALRKEPAHITYPSVDILLG